MIEVCDLSVSYGDAIILRDISFVPAEGKLTCIIGPNGCGKTTLLKAMAGIVPARGGCVKLSGKPISSLKSVERARKVAYLPQSRPVPDLTALSMIRHGRFPHMSFARRFTPSDQEAVELAIDLTNTKALLSKPVAELSGGERQRVYIAMALAQETDILLFERTRIWTRSEISSRADADKRTASGSR